MFTAWSHATQRCEVISCSDSHHMLVGFLIAHQSLRRNVSIRSHHSISFSVLSPSHTVFRGSVCYVRTDCEKKTEEDRACQMICQLCTVSASLSVTFYQNDKPCQACSFFTLNKCLSPNRRWRENTADVECRQAAAWLPPSHTSPQWSSSARRSISLNLCRRKRDVKNM